MADGKKNNKNNPKWYNYIIMILLGPITLPAMWFMAYMYPTWETWIKENGDLVKKWERLLLIIPFSVLMILAIIVYHLFHDMFKESIFQEFGLKLF